MTSDDGALVSPDTTGLGLMGPGLHLAELNRQYSSLSSFYKLLGQNSVPWDPLSFYVLSSAFLSQA